MKEIGLGLLGFGTVGAGVVEGLQRNGDLIAGRSGVKLVLRKIADLDLERDRGVSVDRGMLTNDAMSVIRDPQVHIIIELIGGVGIARELVTEALKMGKPVVTANKKLLAEYGASLFALADANQVDLRFEASVGGGIPIIQALREGLIANHIPNLYGILNGTCNYILTRMETEGLPFDQVLRAAQDAGFAEAEPSLDIDGHDTAHKAALLASLAYGFPIPLDSLYVEGIRGMAREDIAYAADLGYRVKLLAVVKKQDDAVSVRVHPALVPQDHMIASVSGVFNAVMVSGDVVGDTLYYGRGAGRLPTASAVLSDVAAVARQLATQSRHHLPAFIPEGATPSMLPVDDISCRYYLRLLVQDKPGVLARVAGILGEHAISIATMIQKDTGRAGFAEMIMTTHVALEKNCRNALVALNALDVVGAPAVRYRIEDFH
ncbi:MAG TPA: homoserine dehydrogenase [Kiritimatiellia bacterium]|nr:homoserine dehydrogenase [Kiritimatiellia bacterium]HMO98426.1 homoserine dehydrogenase [Kiritimatiellia bacterium]HMP95844.1 homoserine dehydrogenase [Kiritimatiellia bacterium]